MPFTLNMSDTPWGIPLTNAYAVVTNIQAGCTVDGSGQAQEPVLTVFCAIYANEAAYKSGSTPGLQSSFQVTLSSAIMPAIEEAVSPQISALSGVTSVTQVEN